MKLLLYCKFFNGSHTPRDESNFPIIFTTLIVNRSCEVRSGITLTIMPSAQVVLDFVAFCNIVFPSWECSTCIVMFFLGKSCYVNTSKVILECLHNTGAEIKPKVCFTSITYVPDLII